MVRRFGVTISPIVPLPRVAPVTSTPFSYVRLTAVPSILSSAAVAAGARRRRPARAMRVSHSRSSSSSKALPSEIMGTRCACLASCPCGGAPTRCVGESSVRSSGVLLLELLAARGTCDRTRDPRSRAIEHVVLVRRALERTPQLAARAASVRGCGHAESCRTRCGEAVGRGPNIDCELRCTNETKTNNCSRESHPSIS